MSERIPLALFVTRRATCPSCGALVDFAGAEGQVQCAYCGCQVVVERRLRHLEPDVVTRGTLEVDWSPAHLNPGVAHERGACPGCGAALAIDAVQAHVRCPQCDTEVKIERRVRALPRELPPGPPGEDAGVLALLDTLRTSTDLVEQLEVAAALDTWSRAGVTLARHLPRLLDAQRDGDPLLGHALGAAVGKLVCSSDAQVRDAALQAALPYLPDPQGSPALLWQLGLGPGAFLKPLLDAADLLDRAGAARLASTALWAANTLLGRRYPDHDALAEVILYRVLYLQGQPLAWAIDFLGGQSVVRYVYPVGTLLRFLDDCAAERPELCHEIRRGIRADAFAHESDYAARLDLFEGLRSDAARAALLATLEPPPAGCSLRQLRRAAALCGEALDAPALLEGATQALVRLCDGPAGASPLLPLVRERGDALPEAVRREVLKRLPDAPLSPLPRGRSERPAKLVPQPWFTELHARHKQTFSAAVDAYRATGAALQAFRERNAKHTPLMVAARRGELGLLEELLAQGAEVDAASPYGRTALSVAAEAGQTAAVEALLARGADPGRRDQGGDTPLTLAARRGHAPALWAVFAAGGSSPPLLQEAFRAAAQARQWPLVRALLAAGADPDTLEADGATPLILACRAGDLEGAEVLIAAGALLDHADARGRTPRAAAEAAGAAELVALLLQAGG
ncbi:MAG: ankyrin repeat domain-containing protein [Planctomycetota bacterium]